jgi:MFS family permease
MAGFGQGAVLVCVNTAPILAMASLVPSLPRMFQHFAALPGREVLVPMILTVPTLCIGLFASTAGAVADRWGRRRLLMWALAAFALLGMAPMVLDNIYAILACRFAVGLAEAAIPTCGNALMGDYFAGDLRKRWLSYQAVVGPTIGSVVLLAGGALGSISWHLPFLIYGVGGLLAWVAVAFNIWEPQRPSATGAKATTGGTAERFPWAAALQVGSVTLLTALLFFLQNVQHGRIFAGLGLDSPARISVFVMLASLGTIVGGFAFRHIRIKRVDGLLAIVYLCFGVSYIGLSISPDYVIGTAFDALGQFAGGLSFPVLLWWTLGKFGAAHRGRGAGVWSGCFYVGSFLSPLLTGLIGRWTSSFLATVGVLGAYALLVGFGLLASTLRAGRVAPLAPPST